MTAHDEQQLALGLADLSRFERGSASFQVGPSGEIIYRRVVATVKMREGEDLVAFWNRLRRDHDLRDGDDVELFNNSGRLDIARIERKARAA